MAAWEKCLHTHIYPLQRRALAQSRFGPVFTIALLLMCCVRGATAQSTQTPGAVPAVKTVGKAMELQQTRYELRPGEPAQISATDDTLDFLLKAKSRRIQFGSAPAEGLVVGPIRPEMGFFWLRHCAPNQASTP
jgi:hypothetical protein